MTGVFSIDKKVEVDYFYHIYVLVLGGKSYFFLLARAMEVAPIAIPITPSARAILV
jgi:hypothetical protein